MGESFSNDSRRLDLKTTNFWNSFVLKYTIPDTKINFDKKCTVNQISTPNKDFGSKTSMFTKNFGSKKCNLHNNYSYSASLHYLLGIF